MGYIYYTSNPAGMQSEAPGYMFVTDVKKHTAEILRGMLQCRPLI